MVHYSVLVSQIAWTVGLLVVVATPYHSAAFVVSPSTTDFSDSALVFPPQKERQRIASPFQVPLSSSSWLRPSSSLSATGTTTNKDESSSSSQQQQQYTGSDQLDDKDDTYDVIVVGSGIGGLSCAAMLAKYGSRVLVLESHDVPGGAAHGFTARAKGVSGPFRFDTGPSFFSGIDSPSNNPLWTVLQAIDERVECQTYTTFGLVFPEGDFVHTPNFGGHLDDNNDDDAPSSSVLGQVSGPQAVEQWRRLMTSMEPLALAVDALPTAALRTDIGVFATVAPYLPTFATLNPLNNLKLTKPYSKMLDAVDMADPFARNWLDLLCFCLSGLPANGTITAEMAMMMGEFYSPHAVMECPVGGASAIVDALVRGIRKYGGKVVCRTHVDEILLDDGKQRTTGVRINRGGRILLAKQAVVSNVSIWDLMSSGLVDTKALPSSFVQQRMNTPVGKSFMHLHVGFSMTGEELDSLQAHYLCIEDWERGVEAQDNAVLVSIPSVHDNTLAPDGYAVLHAYTPATEDYERWANLDRKSPEYRRLKEERSEYLWKTLAKIIPDIQERAVLTQVGTPLTHERFLRRYKGSYGPAIVAGKEMFPFPKTPIDGLLVCGDSCFPGIGVPAVAGSGLLAAHSVSLASVQPQREFLQSLPKKVATSL